MLEMMVCVGSLVCLFSSTLDAVEVIAIPTQIICICCKNQASLQPSPPAHAHWHSVGLLHCRGSGPHAASAASDSDPGTGPLHCQPECRRTGRCRPRTAPAATGPTATP